jgi:uncharacterized protein with HEPN domain
MQKNEGVRLRHMLDAAREATGFAAGRSRQDLDTNRLLNLALVRLLEIIGEAARGLSQEFRQAHPETPWKDIAGMRDRLIHGYFDVDLDVVWKTVSQDLTPLITQLEQIITGGSP